MIPTLKLNLVVKFMKTLLMLSGISSSFPRNIYIQLGPDYGHRGGDQANVCETLLHHNCSYIS